MLYSEFVEGTGCKDNDHNYQVYRNLEVMYNNTEMTKREIYEYGKKLVDNSKSEAELRAEAEIRSNIEGWKKEIESCEVSIKLYESYIYIEHGDAKYWKSLIKKYRAEIRDYKSRIKFLKSCLD